MYNILFLLIGILIGFLIKTLKDKMEPPDALFIKDEDGLWTLDMQKDVETLHNNESLKISVYLL